MAVNSIFKYGTVVSVTDELDGDRIKVHIRGVDPNNYVVENLPYAFPMLPKSLYVKPKVGEVVFVFSQNDSFLDDRFWIGPIISQPHKLDYDSVSPLAFLNAGLIGPDIAPSKTPENRGLQPDNDDVAVQGRGNSDIIVKDSEVRIRSGKSYDLIKLNKENPTYIQVKHNQENKQGVINIVSDNINILSHKSVDKFNLSDPESLINSKEMAAIMEKAHELPYGDVLVGFLKLFIKAFSSHVHAYAGLPPDLSQIELKNLLEFQLDNILSKNVRIN